MKTLRPALPLFALTIAGCGAMPFAGLDPGVSMTARLALSDHEGRRVLAVVEPWRKSDIATASLKLYAVADGSPDAMVASQTLTSAQLDGTITFNNLRRNTTYKILTEAYTATNVRIDNYAFDPGSCTTPFATTSESAINVGSIALTLMNKDFSGSSTGSGISVVDGQVSEPTGSETITVVGP